MDRSHFLNALGGELQCACMQHPGAIYARLQYMQIHARPLQYLEESFWLQDYGAILLARAADGSC